MEEAAKRGQPQVGTKMEYALVRSRPCLAIHLCLPSHSKPRQLAAGPGPLGAPFPGHHRALLASHDRGLERGPRDIPSAGKRIRGLVTGPRRWEPEFMTRDRK